MIFFDDILIYSPEIQSHIQHTRLVFETLRRNQLYAKWSKCRIGVEEVEYLGHVVSAKRVAVDFKKIQAIVEWPSTKNFESIKGILGFNWILHEIY